MEMSATCIVTSFPEKRRAPRTLLSTSGR
ncbi:hypothetical protein D918_03574 [Trichuris suis]|nr:hypothetical protein D918_03574 [Trichuris suis]